MSIQGTDHYFLEAKGGQIEQFPKKNSFTAKTAKKHHAKGAMGKNRASDFYYSGPVFGFKKILAQAVAQQNKIYISRTTYRWKNNLYPKKYRPFSPPQKNDGPSLRVISKNNPASRKTKKLQR